MNTSPLVALQIANAELTEENAKLKTQIEAHAAWRQGITLAVANLHSRCVGATAPAGTVGA